MRRSKTKDNLLRVLIEADGELSWWSIADKFSLTGKVHGNPSLYKEVYSELYDLVREGVVERRNVLFQTSYYSIDPIGLLRYKSGLLAKSQKIQL